MLIAADQQTTLLIQDRITQAEREIIKGWRTAPRIEFDNDDRELITGSAEVRDDKDGRFKNSNKSERLTSVDVHIVGFAGELAYSRWSGLPLTQRGPNAAGPADDFADGTDAKGTHYSPPFAKVFQGAYSNHQPRWRYVTVLVARDFTHATIESWISAWRFDRERKLRVFIKGKPPCWWVPDHHLNPMERQGLALQVAEGSLVINPPPASHNPHI